MITFGKSKAYIEWIFYQKEICIMLKQQQLGSTTLQFSSQC